MVGTTEQGSFVNPKELLGEGSHRIALRRPARRLSHSRQSIGVGQCTHDGLRERRLIGLNQYAGSRVGQYVVSAGGVGARSRAGLRPSPR